MSQAKVDAYKNAKVNRKNWKSVRTRNRIIGWTSTVVAIAIIIIVSVFINKKNYDSINTGFSEYDEVALASVLGYDGISLSSGSLNIE